MVCGDDRTEKGKEQNVGAVAKEGVEDADSEVAEELASGEVAGEEAVRLGWRYGHAGDSRDVCQSRMPVATERMQLGPRMDCSLVMARPPRSGRAAFCCNSGVVMGFSVVRGSERIFEAAMAKS